MEKEFIPYEQALALKELGFDIPSVSGYSYPNSDNLLTQAILYQQAFRWFREKYKLQAEILWRGDMECFCYKTGKFKYGSHDFSKDDYSTYEKAEQACLIKLIEIIKNKFGGLEK